MNVNQELQVRKLLVEGKVPRTRIAKLTGGPADGQIVEVRGQCFITVTLSPERQILRHYYRWATTETGNWVGEYVECAAQIKLDGGGMRAQ